jgi:tetratricopeptide (TPR) repeat protein
LLVILLGLTLWVFAPVGGHDFIDLDDHDYVSDNPRVMAGLGEANLRWAITAVGENSNWHPLTWLSHMADTTLFGPGPGPRHLVNLGLHAAAAAILFLLLQALVGRPGPAFLAAALFAVHPLHVEPVAWIAARKDVLSTLLWFATLGLWVRYLRRPGGARYALSLACFLLALAAKPMPITHPVLLVLLDAWPLGRLRGGTVPWGRLVVEKIPFAAASAASAVITVVAQERGGGLKSLVEYPLAVRLANAPVAAAGYLVKMVWPARLALVYPHPGASLPGWKVAASLTLLAAVTLLAALLWRRRPAVAFGWAWFLITILPVAGIVQVGWQASADRYTYVPLTGLFLSAGLMAAPRTRRKGVAAMAGLLAALALAALALAARGQVRWWRDSVTLFERTLAVTERNYHIANNLGSVYNELGRLDDAERVLRMSVEIRPDYPTALYNLGFVLLRQRRFNEAAFALSESVRLRPDVNETWATLGKALHHLGRHTEAVAAFRSALRSWMADAETLSLYGQSLEKVGRLDEAERHLGSALLMIPTDAAARQALARVTARRRDGGDTAAPTR